jgi:hypothetical protein
LLGFNREKPTYRFQCRDFRLTDVHGHGVKDTLALSGIRYSAARIGNR